MIEIARCHLRNSSQEPEPVMTELRITLAALGLKPRRQIRQPLRGGVNKHGLHALVETSEDESADLRAQGVTTFRECIKFQSLSRNAVNWN
jgi:hypothetical protein